MRTLLSVVQALLLLGCMWAGPVGAVSFTDQDRRLPLGHELFVFEDVRGTATIKDVSSPALEASFRSQTKPVLNAGYTRSAYWLRLDLEYRPGIDTGNELRLLELAYPPLDSVELYLPDGQGGFQLIERTGDALPFSQRALKQSNYLFALNVVPNEPLRLYLRVQSQGSIQAPLVLWQVIAYLEQQPEQLYLFGAIYGVLLGMLAYNLFIFLSVRDTSYLYYILYIACNTLYLVSLNGVGVQFFWPDSPWLSNTAPPILMAALTLFGGQFIRHFLDTRSFSVALDRCLLALIACAAGLIALTLLSGYALALQLAPYVVLFFIVLAVTSGIMALRRKMRTARYFLIAWSAYIAGGLLYSLVSLGLVANTFWSFYSMQIGLALEVTLLSLALADRINAMKEERTRILRESSEKLELLNRELATSNQLKDEFLAIISHELRTPMNGVIGSLELIKTQPLTADQALYQRTAVSSSREMLRMINDILALTELQAGKLYPRYQPFSLRGLLDGLQVQYGQRAEAKGLSFSLELADDLPDTLEGDASKIAQALGYLLDNALKFTPQGSVSLRVTGEKTEAEGLRVRFDVRDSGVGFSRTDDSVLYQYFRQLDGSLTRPFGGLGIGLALCRQLVELFGGRLSHQSQPGQGSCFSLSLPLLQPMRESIGPKRDSGIAQREPGQCVVLVVEDNPVNQLVLRGMLLKMGYRVCTANEGSQALSLLGDTPVDAVLLDCQMPVMDGFATCRALRSLPGCADLPVLAITAHSHQGDRERCLAAGMNDYMAKPVRFEELQALLHDWVLCRPPQAVEAT